MKLEILQDNKTTKARVGTIMTVPAATGKKWVDKGYARDISQGDTYPHKKKNTSSRPPSRRSWPKNRIPTPTTTKQWQPLAT